VLLAPPLLHGMLSQRQLVPHILGAESRVVVDVLTAVEQMHDAIGIEIQGGRQFS